MKFDNYMILDFPSKSSNEAFARSAVACFAAQIEGRGEDPRNIAGPGLVGADASHLVGEIVVERGGKREFLREEGGAGGI